MLVLSKLPKTWIIDIDGTIFEHNGYLKGKDRLLPEVKDFMSQIPENDFVLLITARTKESEKQLKEGLKEFGIRFNQIIFGAPFGERILINDLKPSGLSTAIAVNVKRDSGLNIEVKYSDDL